MNPSAKKENLRSLADMLGVGEAEASALLNTTVAITHSENDAVATQVAMQIDQMLSRTIERVTVNNVGTVNASAEIVIGSAQPRHNSARVWVFFEKGRIVVAKERRPSDSSDVHSIGTLIAACYACAATIQLLIGDRLRQPAPESYIVDLNELLGGDEALLFSEADFEEAYLVGAGAIGNGFVAGLVLLPIRGKLHVVDDDDASDGNLQRCVMFGPSDVGKKKAEQLVAAARRTSSLVDYEPRPLRLQNLPERKAGAWLKRLVVAVDSPRARRSLQNEFPGEVFDASTTGAAEIVFHYHRQPTEGACLACVYPTNRDEQARERHVAESLGVSVADVMEIKISPSAADKIVAKYPDLDRRNVVGQPYDTLFKGLCSSEKLFTEHGRDVLTPFAFVSTLAGALLALEFFRRIHHGHLGIPNFWRVSPWNNPMPRNRRCLPRNASCDFCGEPTLRNLAAELWRELDGSASSAA
jgi:hypothetical protein